MRECGGFGRAGALAGAIFLSFGLTACFGPSSQPEGYSLGAAESDSSQDKVADASKSGVSNAAPARSTQFASAAGDVVYFEDDSAELSPIAKATLRRQVRWLRQNPDYNILIEGHADEWGGSQHNLLLGAQRAVAVKTYLEGNGIRTASIPTISYGRERLVASCQASSCRKQNRRAQTVVSPPR